MNRKEIKPEYIHGKTWYVICTGRLPKYDETLIWHEEDAELICGPYAVNPC